jgi:hypothetical protein
MVIDVGPTQRVRGDTPSDPDPTGEPRDDRGSVVALHPIAPRVEQQRPVAAFLDGFGDRLLRPGVERNLRRLVALAEDPQRRLGSASRPDRRRRRRTPRRSAAVERQQAHQRIARAAFGLGGGEHVGELVAAQPRLRTGVRRGRRTRAAGLPTLRSSSSSQVNQELRVEMRRRSVPFAKGGRCCSSWRRYASTWVRRTSPHGARSLSAQKPNQHSRSRRYARRVSGERNPRQTPLPERSTRHGRERSGMGTMLTWWPPCSVLDLLPGDRTPNEV